MGRYLDDVFAGVGMRSRESTSTTTSIDRRPCRSRRASNVACRGSKLESRRQHAAPRLTRVGPLSLTTPIPPRPGGVAIATMVSSVENMVRATIRVRVLRSHGRGSHATTRRAEMITVLKYASPMLSDDIVRIFGDGQVHDAARVRIERAHFLRHAARAPCP